MKRIIPMGATVLAMLAVGLGQANAASIRPHASHATGSKPSSLLPASIRTSGVLKVVTAPGVPPLSFLSTNGNTAQGSDIDLINAIGKALGVKVTVANGAFPGELVSAAAGRYDAVIGGITDTKVRQATLTFVDYLSITGNVVVPKGNPDHITGVSSFCGKSVATVQGFAYNAYINQLNAKQCAKNKMTVSPFPSLAAALLALKSGRSDFTFEDSTDVHGLLKSNADLAVIPGNFDGVTHDSIGVEKSNAQLARALQAGLKTVIKNGSYAKILAKWGESANSYTAATINNAG
jgi:polar amino acid transport system substrate-binding protein